MTIIFWIIVVLLILLASTFLLWPLLRGAKTDDVSLTDLNVAVHKQRMAELDQERDQGLISADQYDQAQAEEERALLQDASDEKKVWIA